MTEKLQIIELVCGGGGVEKEETSALLCAPSTSASAKPRADVLNLSPTPAQEKERKASVLLQSRRMAE